MSKSILSKVFIFAAGAAVGSAVTWKLVEAKYRQLANEEIEAVREAYYMGMCDEEDEVEYEDDEEDELQEESRELKRLIKDEGYNDEETEEEEDVIMLEKIDYDDFDEFGFDTETLVYYADGVLAYQDTDEVVDSPDEMVGEDFEQFIGDCGGGPDTAYIRNHTLGIDFEILRDNRSYAEVK